MKIVCAHTRDAASFETREALADYPVRYVRMVADTDYHNLIESLWQDGEAFGIVEPDIIPWRGALEELWGCGEPWCTFGYAYGCPPFEHHGLGCVRFSAEVIAACPDALALAALEHNEVHPARHWCNLDDRITRQLIPRGFSKHQHSPSVGHLHTLPSHEPCGRCACPLHGGRSHL